VRQARPEVLDLAANNIPMQGVSLKKVLAGLAAAALVTGGALSWFASTYPDGLEWSMAKTSGSEELAAPADGVHAALAGLQEKTAFLPDYGFRAGESEKPAEAKAEASGPEEPAVWPNPDMGTSVAGLVGGALTLVLAAAIGMFLRRASVARR
jgi:cobalt/nickel transport system permease protein